jgi:hypothetical protein
MSAITVPRRLAPALTRARAARAPEPQRTSDHGLLIKVVVGVLLVTATVAITAPLGWAVLPVAVAILLATTTAVLHTTQRMLNEDDQ